MHRFLMDFTFDEIVDQLSHCISYVSPQKDKIIIEDSPSDVGFYSNSDIVMFFDNTGLMVLCTERLSAKVGILQFFFCKLYSYFIKDRKGDDIETIVTRGPGYIDVILTYNGYRTYLNLCNIKFDYEKIEKEARAAYMQILFEAIVEDFDITK